MDLHRSNNRIDEITEIYHWKMVTLVIGWIGLALSMIGVPFLWFSYGDNILLLVIYEYGTEYTMIWLLFIIIACRKRICSFFEMNYVL